ncbi:Zn-ribbon domain-containing OB-fold protein [Rhodococcus sp. T2V]|uniref:Zn-ribbon domain-containing OB-fold protein n=1 Tax=Rhodococcus sp. T2V TaxID=3034164 RepID=UPI0023E1C0EB|nr:OB-fold domain-containing protein [Rhodococcus sp. T2V]MDF3308623.1 OB-fold domain-containing protein [Rhodococcus sp. T2V]
MGETPTAPALEASRCAHCSTVAFPAATVCSRCAGPAMSPLTLSARGTVWAYTVQRFAPKSPPYVPPPDGFSPFAVGYVELPEGIRVEGVLDCHDFDELDDGAPVTLVATAPVPRFATDAYLKETR